MLILLPPSEGKLAPRRGRPLDLPGLGAPELTAARERLIRALHEVSTSPGALATLGLTPGLADQLELNRSLTTAPTARADQIYRGVLYEALGFETLSPGARRRAGARVAVVSSVFGIVRPHDRIPAYRLAGGVNLPGVGPVSTYWRSHLADVVPSMLGRGLLIDLRSSTYAGFWRPPPTSKARVVTVRVLHEYAGKRAVVSHFNKATKGRLVRALLEQGETPRTPAAFAATLQRLGEQHAWVVEPGPPSPHGTVFDVIVASL